MIARRSLRGAFALGLSLSASMLVLGFGCGGDDDVPSEPASGGSAGNAGASNETSSGGSAGGGNSTSSGSGGSAGGGTQPDCFMNPQTHLEIINACTDAVKIEKTPDLRGLLPDGSLPPLP